MQDRQWTHKIFGAFLSWELIASHIPVILSKDLRNDLYICARDTPYKFYNYVTFLLLLTQVGSCKNRLTKCYVKPKTPPRSLIWLPEGVEILILSAISR